MILEDIQLTGNKGFEIPELPMVGLCKINAQSLLRIRTLISKTDSKEWLDVAVNEVKLKSNTDELIDQANNEIEKAKKLMKEKFPKEYNKEFWKLVIRNPFKSFIGWLLK